MMVCIYFMVSSLDGFVVDDRDSLDWLILWEYDLDGLFGVDAFFLIIGVVVMGLVIYVWIVVNYFGEWMYV